MRELGKCIKCGYEELINIQRWEKYYCNYYCCTPCCPDAKERECHKEAIERLEKEMEDHLREKGVI